MCGFEGYGGRCFFCMSVASFDGPHDDPHKIPQARAAAAAAKQAAQEDLQSLRTWEFLGGKEGDLWLLTDDQVGDGEGRGGDGMGWDGMGWDGEVVIVM